MNHLAMKQCNILQGENVFCMFTHYKILIKIISALHICISLDKCCRTIELD